MLRDELGPYFGEFGGRFVPESLIAALDELDAAYNEAKNDPEFAAELAELHASYTGRPSIITEVPRFAEHAGGARIILKREDLNHTGSHKINNVLGQALLARRLGKTRLIAETGAGQHGVATATAAALFGMSCVVYMGEVDTERQALNVARMRLLGAEVIPVTTGSRTLKDAINEATARLGRQRRRHPLPLRHRRRSASVPRHGARLPRDHRRRGAPAGARAHRSTPDAVAACVGGGSNAIGIFHAFLDDTDVALYGYEAAGEGHLTERHAATITKRPPRRSARCAQLHAAGRRRPDHRVALDLGGARLPRRRPRALLARGHRPRQLRPITDAEAMEALRLLSRTEGIIPAIESAHALAGALELGKQLGPEAIILVNLCGRGDKDMETAAEYFELIDSADASKAGE